MMRLSANSRSSMSWIEQVLCACGSGLRLVCREPRQLASNRCDGLAGEETERAPQQHVERLLAREENPVMPLSPSRVQADEVSNIVGQERPPFLDGRVQLLVIGHAKAVGAHRADDIKSPVAENIRQQGADVFIQRESDYCHAASVCSRMRRSRSARWS